MPATELKDPKYQVHVDAGEEAFAHGELPIILDEEGRWVNIPCASDTLAFLHLVKTYYKSRVQAEIDRLASLRPFFERERARSGIVLHTGLFMYNEPQPGLFGESEWKGSLVQSLQEAGFDVHPIPSQLFPSLITDRNQFLDYPKNPRDYNLLSYTMQKTYVLSPALSYFLPDQLSGECLAIGYQAAIGIDGSALLGLFQEDQIERWENPDFSRIYTATVQATLKNLIEE